MGTKKDNDKKKWIFKFWWADKRKHLTYEVRHVTNPMTRPEFVSLLAREEKRSKPHMIQVETSGFYIMTPKPKCPITVPYRITNGRATATGAEGK